MTPTENKKGRFELISLKQDVDVKEWEGLLCSDPHATVFQHPDWSHLYVASFANSSANFLELREDGRLLAAMPFVRHRKGIFYSDFSHGAGVYGGPVLRDGNTEYEKTLLDCYFSTSWRSLQKECIRAGGAKERASWKSVESAIIEPGDDFELFYKNRFPANRRKLCSRSDRRGLKIVLSSDESHMDAFLGIYFKQCKQWNAKAYPEKFLKDVFHWSKSMFFVSLLETEVGEKVMGGHLCFSYANELFAWLGTTERSKEVFPSALLIREELRYCCENNIARLNLGSSMQLEGVMEYKTLFGAVLEKRYMKLVESPLMKLKRVLKGGGS